MITRRGFLKNLLVASTAAVLPIEAVLSDAPKSPAITKMARASILRGIAVKDALEGSQIVVKDRGVILAIINGATPGTWIELFDARVEELDISTKGVGEIAVVAKSPEGEMLARTIKFNA